MRLHRFTVEITEDARERLSDLAQDERRSFRDQAAVVLERTLTNPAASELQATFDLRWKADMRAIKRWQEAHPDRPNVELTWPDHADMVVWLLGRVEDQEASLQAIADVVVHGKVPDERRFHEDALYHAVVTRLRDSAIVEQECVRGVGRRGLAPVDWCDTHQSPWDLGYERCNVGGGR